MALFYSHSRKKSSLSVQNPSRGSHGWSFR